MSSMQTVCRDLRQMRACLSCSLIKTVDQFEADGCENCDSFLQMKKDREAVYDCTSANFDGMVAAMDPQDSWVCKWQRTNQFVKGIYAISVSGELPKDVIREMKSKKIPYVSRDRSK